MDPLPGESGRSDEGMVRAMSVAFKQYRGADRRAWGISDSAHAGGSVRALPGTHAQGDADPDGRPHRDGTALCVPSGWPESVSAPGTQRMESDAVGFLLDCCPPDYRAYPLLRREAVVLARFAADQVEGQLRSTRKALSQARVGLGEVVGPEVLDGAVSMLESEESRLIRLRRAVALVEEALRGKVFMRKL